MNRRTLLQSLAASPLLAWLPGLPGKKKPRSVITVTTLAHGQITPFLVELLLPHEKAAQDFSAAAGEITPCYPCGPGAYYVTEVNFAHYLENGLEAKLRALGTELVVQYPPPEDLGSMTCKPSDATEKIHMTWWSA